MGSRVLLKRIAFTCALLSVSFVLARAQVTVHTTSGRIQGSTGNGTVVFKGIPYAKPPVGDLRWRPPQAPIAWQGIRKTTDSAASCMQVKAGERLPWTKEFMVANPISEDCLYLNIWTQKIGIDAKRPVIVFIHGGGFVEGSGAIDVYNGANLAARGVVVVTINYRLGVFGFLAHPELTAESKHHSSGNYALMDQVAALKWVNENISQFGGDPHNITIWGQSAGAFSVAALVASPLAAGVFQHAQADSGLGIISLPMQSLSAAEGNGVKFAALHHAASIKDLRAMPAESLLPGPQTKTTAILQFGPIVDGWVLPDTPLNMNAKGSDNDVAVITGYQAGDPAMFAPKITTPQAFDQMAQKQYGDLVAEFKKLYPVSKVDDIQNAMADSAHDRSRVSMFLWASARIKNHRQPVYTYFFDRGIPWPQHPEFGAFHTGEIPYFFLNLNALDRPWGKEDHALAKEVSSYLVNFATKGDPNGAGLSLWPKVDPRQPKTMELGIRSGPMPLADKAKVEFWTRYFNSPISNTGPPF
jgi:para-nitrobenzyl esterase